MTTQDNAGPAEATALHVADPAVSGITDIDARRFDRRHTLRPGWQSLAIKRIATVSLGKMLQSEPSPSTQRLVPYIRAAHIQPDGKMVDVDEKKMWVSDDESDRMSLKEGDVLVVEGGVGGFGRSACLREPIPDTVYQNSIVRVRPREGRSHGAFLDYALQAARGAGFIRAVVGVSTMPHFTSEKVAKFFIAVPSLDEQRRIADFLDRETAEIDTLVAKQQELIATLRERRVVLVESVMALGMSHVTLRDDPRRNPLVSRSVKWLANFVNGSPFKPDELGDSGYPVIRIAQLSDADGPVDYAEPPKNPVWIDDNDLVFSWSASLGVHIWDRGLALLNQHLYRVDAFPGVDARWLRYVLVEGIVLLEGMMHGSAMTHITQSMLWSLCTTVPTLHEQRRIADYLDTEIAKIDALIAKAEEFIEVAKERRSALITAAVTGQLEIGEAA